jgi:hypothetical protein
MGKKNLIWLDIIKSWPKKFVMCHTHPTKKQSCYPSQSWHLDWPTTRGFHGWGEKKPNLFEVGRTIGYGTYLLKLSFKPPKRENKMQEKILCFHPLLACLLSPTLNHLDFIWYTFLGTFSYLNYFLQCVFFSFFHQTKQRELLQMAIKSCSQHSFSLKWDPLHSALFWLYQ